MTEFALSLGALETLRPFFGAQPYGVSVYSLLSVMAWRNADGYDVTYVIEGDLLLIVSHRGEICHAALPIGKRIPSPEELRELALSRGFSEYIYVPQDYIDAVGEGDVRALFDMTERREWAEYLFRTEDLAELKGKRLAPKRNLIHQFEKSHVQTGRVHVGSIEPSDVAECAAFLDAWCIERGCDEAGHKPLSCERRAARTALEEMHELKAEGVLVRVDGAVVGFGIGYRVTDALGALHFEKAFASIKGLYQYLDRECARRLFLGKFECVTKESDMGLPGLAQAKQSYGPSAVVPCYALAVRK